MRARLTNLLELRRGHLKLRDRGRWLAEEVRKATERALHLANHDVLTGLPNRAHFHIRLEEELARAKRNGGQVAVLCLDLDGFKAVNDMLGHASGDELLRQIGTKLLDNVRKSDALARLGGDDLLSCKRMCHSLQVQQSWPSA